MSTPRSLKDVSLESASDLLIRQVDEVRKAEISTPPQPLSKSKSSVQAALKALKANDRDFGPQATNPTVELIEAAYRAADPYQLHKASGEAMRRSEAEWRESRASQIAQHAMWSEHTARVSVNAHDSAHSDAKPKPPTALEVELERLGVPLSEEEFTRLKTVPLQLVDCRPALILMGYTQGKLVTVLDKKTKDKYPWVALARTGKEGEQGTYYQPLLIHLFSLMLPLPPKKQEDQKTKIKGVNAI